MGDFKVFIPSSLKAFLLKKGKSDLLDLACSTINLISPEDFLEDFSNNHPALLSTGFNGIIFASDRAQIYKISHLVLACFSKADLNEEQIKTVDVCFDATRSRWQPLSSTHQFNQIDVHAFLGSDEVGVTSPLFETLGGLVWAAYSSESVLLPDLLTEDGYGLRRPFVDGVTLREILKKEANEGPHSSGFDMTAIWKKVADLQKRGERMLVECGCTIDLFNPGNLIINGDPSEPSVALIDTELVLPSREAMTHYSSIGVSLPTPIFPDLSFFVAFPVMPEQIVLSRLWSLNFEQAIDYLSIFRECTKEDAIKRLSEIPEWKIEVNPMMQDYSNIRRAKELLVLA